MACLARYYVGVCVCIYGKCWIAWRYKVAYTQINNWFYWYLFFLTCKHIQLSYCCNLTFCIYSSLDVFDIRLVTQCMFFMVKAWLFCLIKIKIVFFSILSFPVHTLFEYFCTFYLLFTAFGGVASPQKKKYYSQWKDLSRLMFLLLCFYLNLFFYISF